LTEVRLKGVMVVNPAEGPAAQLARRLRSLRLTGFGNRRLTQADLAEAFDMSVPSISSWENRHTPKPPTPEQLDAYATFFATERSVANSPFRVLPLSQLTSDERARRDELLRELTRFRNGAQGHEPGPTADDPFAGSPWRFPPDEDITIVCSALPEKHLKSMPYTDPNRPDYVDLYKYADLDALIELHGYLRAANPLSTVRFRTPAEVRVDDYTTHLVLLGGVDWNKITKELLDLLEVPVFQLARESDAVPGGFRVAEGADQQLFEPVLRKEGDREVLIEDIAHFFRAPNPLNDKRTVTICNGMYQRGTYGAVRALTDRRFRDRNRNYVHTRFGDETTFSILSRVKVILGKAVTPDWREDLLHEWPVPPE
jgi:transcriptional regulator with XRE-family HTH domain